MCMCLRNANRQLADNGARVATVTPRDAAGNKHPPRVVLRVVAINTGNAVRTIAVATHCPFCGTKYED